MVAAPALAAAQVDHHHHHPLALSPLAARLPASDDMELGTSDEDEPVGRTVSLYGTEPGESLRLSPSGQAPGVFLGPSSNLPRAETGRGAPRGSSTGVVMNLRGKFQEQRREEGHDEGREEEEDDDDEGSADAALSGPGASAIWDPAFEWTYEDDVLRFELIRLGLEKADIGAWLGRTTKEVKQRGGVLKARRAQIREDELAGRTPSSTGPLAWTAEDDALLRQVHTGDASIRKAAKYFPRRRMFAVRARWDAMKDQWLAQGLISAALSLPDGADGSTSTPPAAVPPPPPKKLTRPSHPSPARVFSPEEDEELRRLRVQRTPWNDVVKKLRKQQKDLKARWRQLQDGWFSAGLITKDLVMPPLAGPPSSAAEPTLDAPLPGQPGAPAPASVSPSLETKPLARPAGEPASPPPAAKRERRSESPAVAVSAPFPSAPRPSPRLDPSAIAASALLFPSDFPPWSVAEDARLLELQDDGLATARMAMVLGRPERSVEVRLRVLEHAAQTDACGGVVEIFAQAHPPVSLPLEPPGLPASSSAVSLSPSTASAGAPHSAIAPSEPVAPPAQLPPAALSFSLSSPSSSSKVAPSPPDPLSTHSSSTAGDRLARIRRADPAGADTLETGLAALKRFRALVTEPGQSC
ncbi:uncharacterized protein JCM10292_003828 [Rhodotorula paludigena]|uniref:uncharacterized protein n=1 Tax=Rhodotorula paludigena TaxID=86838 RepID=UPI003171C534